MRRAIFLCLLVLCGCGLRGYRAAKVLSGRLSVLDAGFSSGATLAGVWYHPGGFPRENKPPHPLPSVPYELYREEESGNPHPPRLFSGSSILLELHPGADPLRTKLRVFIKNDPEVGADLTEVHTLVGEIPGALPNEVTFIGDLFPRQYPRLVLYPADLAGPYQGVKLQAHDWIILQLEDLTTGALQRAVFEYVPLGPRARVGPQLLLSTGINLIDVVAPENQDDKDNVGAGQINTQSLDLAFTLTAAIGYRGTAASGARRWLGDNFAVVIDIGVGNVGEIEKIVGGGTENAISILQNQLLVGVGVQVFDSLSFHLLNNVFADFDVGAQEVEAVLVPEVGFDVAAASRFGRRLYERLFTTTVRRSYGEGTPRVLPPPRPARPTSAPLDPAPTLPLDTPAPLDPR